jgi:acyl-CoA hydrolase
VEPAAQDEERERMSQNARPVRDSVSEYSELALPNDANPLGNLLGGRVMHLVDLCGALAAARHARKPVVTASIDSMHFLHPVHIGQLVILRSHVNRVFTTSMEVGVKVWVEDLMTGDRRHTSSAYLTFVALDEKGQPSVIPRVIPETEDEKRRFEAAGVRRTMRLEMRARSLQALPEDV